MFSKTHQSFDAICASVDSGDDEAVRELVDVRANIAKVSLGRVEITDNQIFVAGRLVTGALVERILEMVSRGSKAVDGYIKFLDNMMLNPSSTAVKELYMFIEACDLPITADGYFLAYKRVNGDYRDIHSNTFDNSVGTTPTMDRNEVDDNRENTCSQGLHFCSYDYLPHFGSGGSNKVVVVKINPANVVSIPSDYNNAKGRTWQYEVVDEIHDWVNDRITPFYTDDYSDLDYDEDGIDEDDYDVDGYDRFGFDRDGYDEDGYDRDGYDRDDYDVDGYDRDGYDVDGYDEGGYDHNGYNSDGYDECGYDTDGLDIDGRDADGYDKYGRDEDGYDRDGYDKSDTDENGDDRPPSGGNKLSANDVRSIKNIYLPLYNSGEVTLTAIGKMFNVHRETIARIGRGDIWADVT